MKNGFQEIYLKDYKQLNYSVKEIKLAFDISEEKTVVKARQHIELENPEENTVVLSGDSLELNSIYINGQLLEISQYELSNSELKIINVPSKFILDIENTIYPHLNKALSGLYKTKNIFLTQCEPHGFRRITYAPDRPDISSIYTVSITADKDKYPILLSNGDKQEEMIVKDNRKTVSWRDPFPKPSYLFALVAGNLVAVQDHYITSSGKKVDIFLYVEDGQQEQCLYAIDALKKAMKWDEVTYNREYDLNTYMIVAAEDFNMGAMENKGLNIFNISCVNTHEALSTDAEYLRVAAVIAHEYFHNWSGNRVTCRDWFQLSLKEGLTVYRENQFMQDTFPEALARVNNVNKLIEYQFSEDSGPMSHAVQTDSYIEINNFYTATVYEKGAEIIRMLHTLIGDQKYYQAMDDYFNKYDGTCATIDNFVKCMEESSRYELTKFKRWYKQHGTPKVIVHAKYDYDNKTLSVKLEQTAPNNDQQTDLYPLVIPVKISLYTENGTKIISNFQNNEAHTHVLEFADKDKVFIFSGVNNEPIVSIFEGLSAPIKVIYDKSFSDDRGLMLYAEDEYNRWQAAQSIHKKELDFILQNPGADLSDEYIQCIGELLSLGEQENNYCLVAYMLVLPKVKTYIQDLNDIDVDKIYLAYNKILSSIYREYKHKIHDIYHLITRSMSEVNSISSRIFKNSLLYYIASNKTTETAKFLTNELEQTNNITEQVNLLSKLCHINSLEWENKISEFHAKWKMNIITYEKWLRLVSMSSQENVLEKIKDVKHKDKSFNAENPNHMRALYGTFGMENLLQFHRKSGEGHQLILDEVIEIDSFNPQLSARLIQAFSNWKKLHLSNRESIYDKISKLLENPGISKDLYEVAKKILAP